MSYHRTLQALRFTHHWSRTNIETLPAPRQQRFDLESRNRVLYPMLNHLKPPKWWRMTGSNRRPPACKAGALPAELIPQASSAASLRDVQHLVGLVGFEPTTPALSRRCSNQLSYRPKPVTRDLKFAFPSPARSLLRPGSRVPSRRWRLPFNNR